MQHFLPKILPNFTKANVLVIGDVMLDRYWFGETGRISPEAPVPIVKINHQDYRPGGAANVALNIAALGADVSLLGVIGQDDAGTTLSQLLTNAGINQYLCTETNVATIVKLRVLSRHQQLIRLDFEDQVFNTPATILQPGFEQALKAARLVILSDYKKGTLNDPQFFIQRARAAQVPVVVDPKSTDFSIYRDATVITPNFKEFEAVVGPCLDEQDIYEKGCALLAAHHIEALILTRGEDGITIIKDQSITHLPAYAREVYDVTGAGDTVIGVLGASLAADLNLEEATALANLSASLVVDKLGVVSVSAPELQVALTGKTSYVTGIVNDEQLIRAVKEARTQGEKIVFTNGCFDLLHAGHVMALQMAKELGDFLIVAVNTDESIRKLKGEHRPINRLEHRMTVLAGLGVVDWVTPFADATPERLLRALKPDVLTKGADYSLDQVVGADIVRSYGGEVRIMNPNIDTSSSAMIRRIQQSMSKEVAS